MEEEEEGVRFEEGQFPAEGGARPAWEAAGGRTLLLGVRCSSPETAARHRKAYH